MCFEFFVEFQQEVEADRWVEGEAKEWCYSEWGSVVKVVWWERYQEGDNRFGKASKDREEVKTVFGAILHVR